MGQVRIGATEEQGGEMRRRRQDAKQKTTRTPHSDVGKPPPKDLPDSVAL